MGRRLTGGTLLVLLVVSAITGIGIAQEEPIFVRGNPNLDVFVPDPTVTPGQTTEVSIQVANDGDVSGGVNEQRALVTTARNVRVDVDSDDERIIVETDRQSIGSIADGTAQSVPITITVPANIGPGEYELDVELRYSFTELYSSRSGTVQDRTRTVTRSIDLVVDERPRFTLQIGNTTGQIGETGVVAVEVTNAGGEPARDLDVVLTSTSPSVTFGEQERATTRVNRLAPGATTTLSYEIGIQDETVLRNYSLDGTIRYTDQQGVRRVADDLSVGFSPLGEQEFTVDVDSSTLRPGETGTLTGTITNTGPVPVESVVIQMDGSPFGMPDTTYAIGSLGIGESAGFEFRATVPAGAAATPQRLDLTTHYRTAAGSDGSVTDTTVVAIAERRDAVTVTAIDPTFVAGDSGTLELEVQNHREEEIRDVHVRLAVEDPLESDFRSAVVPTLAPGETGQVAFDLSIDSDARINQYPAAVSINYTDPTGDPASVRPQTVPVAVTDTEEAFPIGELVVGILVLLLVIGGGWWFYGKRLV